jgi:transcriptional regulator with XRE-family HTH domain/KaiC/GvpD/RAD55 family RecA-like ATPase
MTDARRMTGKISSGAKSLDALIEGFSIGDNVVWETDAGTMAGTFIRNFVAQSISDSQKIIYVSFNRSPQTIMNELGIEASSEHFTLVDCFTSGKGKNDITFLKFYEKPGCSAVRIEDPRDINGFTHTLNEIEDKLPPGARYVFDSLTGMQDLWGDENDTHRFFTYMCPRLYDLDTVAYWMLEKEAHSSRFKANLRHITQVVIDLSKRKNSLYLKTLKFEGSEDREAFKPHQYEVRDDVVKLTPQRRDATTDIGGKLKEERLRVGMSQKELADKVGLTPSFVSQLESDQVSPSLSTFMQLCKALGIQPGHFLNADEEAPLTWLVKKNMIFLRHPQREDPARIYRVDTESGFSARIAVLPPGAELNRHFSDRNEKELLYVIEGTLLVTVAGRKERVVRGDILGFRESFPTYWKNEGGDDALVLVVG